MKSMQNNQARLVSLILVGLLLAGGIYYFYTKNSSDPKTNTVNMTYPSGGETLVAGKTYTLKWKNPEATGTTTQIFLVDKSLLSQGASVSITDRIYNVHDTGSYDYTVPTAVADGTYFFVVGTNTMSKDFKIVSSE